MNQADKRNLEILACKARMGAIIGTFHAKSGHPGGSLSAADMFTYLYFKEMNVDPSNPSWEEPLCIIEGTLLPQPVRHSGAQGLF